MPQPTPGPTRSPSSTSWPTRRTASTARSPISRSRLPSCRRSSRTWRNRYIGVGTTGIPLLAGNTGPTEQAQTAVLVGIVNEASAGTFDEYNELLSQLDAKRRRPDGHRRLEGRPEGLRGEAAGSPRRGRAAPCDREGSSHQRSGDARPRCPASEGRRGRGAGCGGRLPATRRQRRGRGGRLRRW